MPRQKLTEKDAQDILNLRRGRVKMRVLAAMFGVTTGAISHIITGRTWGHLDRTGIETKSRIPRFIKPKPQPEPEIEPLEAQPEPEPKPTPTPKLEPKPVRDPDKQCCEKCDRVMEIENTSNARYTVFVLWRCVCGHQTLEKRHPGTLRPNLDPDFFEKRTG